MKHMHGNLQTLYLGSGETNGNARGALHYVVL